MTPSIEVSVVLPCLNEAGSIGACIDEAKAALDGFSTYEIIVVDNGSSDDSGAIAEHHGALVIHEEVPGYGRAIRTGIANAKGRLIVMADADSTYDLSSIPRLLAPVVEGEADLVLGSRLNGATRQTMPVLHRIAGTPLLTHLIARAGGRLEINDSQSGFRAFKKDTVVNLGLLSDGMEYASEMLIRGAQKQLRIIEIPSDYRPRVGTSKLHAIRDGWRHIKMIVLLAPHVFLFGPGVALLVVGLLLSILGFVSPDGFELGSIRWQPIFFSSIASVLGLQAMLVGAVLAHDSPVSAPSVRERFSFVGRTQFALSCLRFGLLAMFLGFVLDGVLFISWLTSRSLFFLRTFASASLAQTLIMAGASTASFGFVRRLIVSGIAGERGRIESQR